MFKDPLFALEGKESLKSHLSIPGNHIYTGTFKGLIYFCLSY